MKRNTLHFGVAGEKEIEKKCLFKEIIAEKFPNLDRDLNILAHELTGLPKIST